ncbi:MAG TPA: fibronectin type III domain-containing protein, partial [Gemmataceae bacterium]
MKWSFLLRFVFPSLAAQQDKHSTRGRRTVTLRLEPLEDRLTPAVLTVGPGQMFALPSQAAAVAHDGDTIDIFSNGNYNGDTCRWTQNNLTIQGVGGGRAHIDITGQTAFGDKAIWVIDGSNTTVNNIELSGAHDTLNTGNNWAGIRQEGNTLTLNNDYFHNNDDGILVNATNTSQGPTSNIAIYGSEFAFNGFGDGQSHNMYIGQVTSFTLENSYSHDANVGHLVKSRALTNYILYNRLEDGSASTSTASYELDLPQGGTSYVIGNLIEQGPNSQNGTIIAYSEEGTKNPSQSLYLINNTIVNDRSAGTFVNLAYSASSALLENNIFCGPGTVVGGPGSATQTTNLVSNSPGFVNRAGYDYHLTAGSPAINAGTAPGTVNGFNLTPTSEYVDPLSLQPRPVDGAIDIGAYEFVSQSPPAAPTGLTATAGPGQVALSWTASSGAASYNIYRGTSSGGETKIASGVTTTAYSDSGLSAGTTYFYEVTAVNSVGESGLSNEASATTPSVPAAPTNLTASANPAQVALSWTASSGAPSYNIYRGTSSGGETEVASGVMATAFTDSGLSAGTTYFYEVTAVNSVGESGFSNEASA